MEEYRELLKSGASMSFVQYANEKQSSQPKSYLQFVTDKRTGKPDVRSHGDASIVKKPDAVYYKSMDSTPAKDMSYMQFLNEKNGNKKEKASPSELMEEAREKYNTDNVNVCWEGDPADDSKLNIYFYPTGNDSSVFTNIKIKDSLAVNSKYEMAAIVEVIMGSKYYSEEKYGSKQHMVAQWMAHNLCHDIAAIENTPEKIKELTSVLSGADNPLTSSAELDIREVGNTLKRQDIIYAILEQFAPENGETA